MKTKNKTRKPPKKQINKTNKLFAEMVMIMIPLCIHLISNESSFISLLKRHHYLFQI